MRPHHAEAAEERGFGEGKWRRAEAAAGTRFWEEEKASRGGRITRRPLRNAVV